jgi:hypothetical protein
MFDKLILMTIGLAICLLFFFVSFIMLHLQHMVASIMCLALSACGLTGFILTMADEGK